MALQALPDGASAVVRTSNEYAFKGITVWSTKWRESSFRLSAEGKPLKDSDLWLAIERQRMRLSVVFQHTPNFLENSASPGAARGLAQALAAMEAKRIAKTLLKERAAATAAHPSRQP
ncbi:MAG: hypothetical protein EPO12_05060 [Aquabacterium sp.]|nr:MAG: hypothetical protein EPO12_05060 [Aquabacterium sp.]